MLQRILILALCVVMAAPAAAVTLEYLTNPTGGTATFDVNHDGSRVAANFQGQVYLLDAAGNYTLINTLPTYNWTVGISSDGSTIVTNTVDSLAIQVPVILREADGWLPHLLSVPAGYASCDISRATGYKISGDGSKVTGLLWDGCTGKAFLWTEATGMQDLGPTRGTNISEDGSVIVGFVGSGRAPAYWNVDGNIGSSSTLLHHAQDQGEVHDVSSDGQVLVGTGLPYGYDPILTGFQAFRYEMGDTNFTLLGTLSGSPNDISKALMIADNGMIIGASGPSANNVTAFIWTPTLGMTSLKQYLLDAGIAVSSAVRFTFPKCISADGSTLIGDYIDLYGGWGFYRVNFSAPSSVQDVVRQTSRLTGVTPNPFNPMTTISFALESRQQATVTVYDISGRRVAVIADDEFDAGDHELTWRGTDQSGREVSSGSYVVRLESRDGSQSQTISLVR
jgi:hypothetical protein